MLRKAYWRCEVFCFSKGNEASEMAQRLSERYLEKNKTDYILKMNRCIEDTAFRLCDIKYNS